MHAVTVAGIDKAEPIASPQRKPRMKRSGHPHPQIWLRATSAEVPARVRLPAAATVDEMVCGFTRASLSPAHFAFLRSYRRRLEWLMSKASATFDRHQPAMWVGLKRIATLTAAFASTMATLRTHRWASLWQ
jgi:hypothetical protein